MSASLVLMLALVTALTSISARVGAQTPPTPAPAPAPADFLSFASDELLNPLGTQRQRDLYIMRVDGTDKKKLTSGFNVWFASWSPDGKRLAVTTEGAQLFTLNPDGSDLKQIAGGAYSPPFWSPDGHFIAYVGGEKFALPLAKGNLRIVPAAGGTPWPVPHGEDIPSLPPGAAAVAWSPDGTRIATGWPGRILHIAGGPDAPVGVEALKGAGAGKFVIAGGWSPDNKHLAVTDGKDYGILDMSTGEFVSVAKSFPQPALARAGVSWSAGIRKVAFSINSAASDGQRLFLADFDGRNPKLILSHPHKAFYNGDVSDYGPPFFSADSKTMLLRVSRTTSLRGELLFTHESWLVNTDGSGGKKLTDGFNANWQPKTRLRLPDAGFWFTWRLYDLPVANGQVTRPYLWGPTAIYSGTEMLATAEDTRSARPVQDPALLARQVVYFDKGRMEIHDPNPLQPTRYLVTPGALAKELVTGQIYNSLKDESRTPPDILVVGDNPNADAPTYATFNKLGAGTDASKAQDRTGQPIEATLARDGTVRADAELGALAKVGAFVPETGHNLPDAFLAYFKSQPWDWIYIAGYPISEPYWAHVEIAGQPANVLVQVFERRTVTYDPAAPAGFKVQFGNVGKQYYDWRYTK
jgi:WD40 repeat protein